jgi:glycosyltransferase involved in cell wall biosynthesis
VFAQTVPVREVIVVDDGSTDETDRVVARFPEVRLLRTPRVGPAAARNAGAAAATGALLAFLDSDDVWLTEKTARQLARLRERPDAALVYSDYAFWDGKTPSRKGVLPDYAPGCEGSIYPALLLRNRVNCSTAMVRADRFRSVGGFVTTPRLVIGEDWATWLRLAKQYPFAFVPEVLAYYRIHPGQNQGRAEPFEQCVGAVLDMEYSDASVPEEVRRLRRRRMALFRRDVADRYYHEKRFGRAALNAVRSFCWSPLSAAPLCLAAKALVRGALESVGVSPTREGAAGV